MNIKKDQMFQSRGGVMSRVKTQDASQVDNLAS